MRKNCTGFKVFLIVLYATSAYFNHVVGIQVTSTGPQTIKRSQGTDVTLSCTYSESPSDTGQLDVEWSIVSPDMTQKDNLILSYSGGEEYKLGDPNLMSRLMFVGNPSQGNATITISSVRESDTATYQCKVKKPPGVDSQKITLVILVRPSVPKCWVQNGEEIGGTVSLYCKSSQGSIPLTYKWIKENGALPSTAVQKPQTGELLIYNHSQSYTGNYVCMVNNEVGMEQCKYTLKAYNPVNKAGVIAGAVIGALLLLLLLLLLIWLLICCYQKKRYEKETANEIREDAAAPESRPGSRHSSFRSIMGYHPHQGVTYSSVRNSKPGRADSSIRNFNTNQSHVPSQGPLRYDSKYGFAV